MTLSYEQTVPRSLVHRAALAEVYVADSAQTGDGEFALAIQIPRAHCVWFDRSVPHHDPLSTAEAARQGVYVVAQRYVGIPDGVVFSLHRLELSVVDLERYRDDARAPLQGILRLTLAEHATSTPRFGTMTFEGDVALDGAIAMTLSGDLAYLPQDDYAALREFHRSRAPVPMLPPAAGVTMPPAAVGRRDPRNCVLAMPASGSGTVYPLIVDESHPAFFDHPYDHVPGPLLIEAFRQAAVAAAHGNGLLRSPVAAVTECRVEFSSFAELDARLECHVTLVERADEDGARVSCSLMQLGKELARAEVEVRPYADG